MMESRTDPTAPPASNPPQTAPHGASTIIEILAQAKEIGFGVQQVARDHGRIECGACGEQSDASDFDIEHVRRLEGASDAADMLLITLAACPRCRAGGALTLTYGPTAGATDEAVLEAIDLSSADAGPM